MSEVPGSQLQLCCRNRLLRTITRTAGFNPQHLQPWRNLSTSMHQRRKVPSCGRLPITAVNCCQLLLLLHAVGLHAPDLSVLTISIQRYTSYGLLTQTQIPSIDLQLRLYHFRFFFGQTGRLMIWFVRPALVNIYIGVKIPLGQSGRGNNMMSFR